MAAALTANTILPKPLQWSTPEGIIVPYPVKASAVIFKGGLVSAAASGLAANALVSGENFLGIAQEAVTGGASDGTKVVNLLMGAVVRFTVSTSVALALIGNACFCTTDNPLDINVTATGTAIGRIISVYPTSTLIVVLKWPGQAMGWSNAATAIYTPVVL